MQITSHTNSKIKLARSLHLRKARQESGLFIVEGIRHVGEAIEAKCKIAYILYAPDLLHSEYALKLVIDQSQQGVGCYATSPDIFESVTDKDNPQGILAVVHQSSRQLPDLTPENFAWGVALVDPQDPGNLGAILRTIDAVGASGLILLSSRPGLVGFVDPYHPQAVRASMGTLFWYPIVSTSFDDFVPWVSKNDYHVYGTSAHASVDYRYVERYSSPKILLMGSEREGLTPDQTFVCESTLQLPMLGRATSLNLAVATGILLYNMLAKTRI